MAARFTTRELIATSLIALQSCTAVLSQSCYFPNGVKRAGSTPCNASASVSACCGSQAVCLSNGLCMTQGNYVANRLSRDTCTDPTWQDPACPQYCADVWKNSGISLFLGPETPQGSFCCGKVYDPSSESCTLATQGSTQPFNLSGSYVIMDRTDGSTVNLLAYAANAASISSTNTGPASATSAMPVTTITVGATSTANPSSDKVAIGAGVGAPLGLCLLVALGLLWQQWRQKKTLQQRIDQLSDSRSGDPKMQYVPPQGQVYSPLGQDTNLLDFAHETNATSATPGKMGSQTLVEMDNRERAELGTM